MLPPLDEHHVARLLASFAVAVLGTYLALLLLEAPDVGEHLLLRDYYCFYRAGELVLAGGTGYEDEYRTFANPPFTLPLVAVLALLGPIGSYAACLFGGVVAFGLAMWALASLPGTDPRFRLTLLAVGFASPSLLFALHLGQATPLYVLLSCLLVYGWCHERDGLAGVAAGLLCAKPPLALFFVVIGALTRPRRFLLTFLLTLVGLCALGSCFGIEAWRGFLGGLDTLVARHEHHPDSWRIQLTLYALIRWTLWHLCGSPPDDLGAGRDLARGLVAAIALALGAWALRTGSLLRAQQAPRSGPPTRLASIAVLASVALNLYLFYYDAALVVIPTALLFTHATAWRSRARWWCAVVLAAVIWLAQLLPMTWSGGPNPVGALALLWLVLELVELAATTRAPAQASTA